MPKLPAKRRFLRFPVVSLSAEQLAMGWLMRRNILAYKAPPGNEGYDLLCVHPDPRHGGKQIRIQVKSRLATDCDRGFPVREGSLDAFDFLIVVFLNVGYFSRRAIEGPRVGARSPELYTLPAAFVRKHHIAAGVWQKVRTRGLDLVPFRDEAGIELVAKALKLAYPARSLGC
jgi:hypothetical protein